MRNSLVNTVVAVLVLISLPVMSCGNRMDILADAHPDDGTADTGPDPLAWDNCTVGQTRCMQNEYQVCQSNGEFTQVMTTNCNPAGQSCIVSLGGCVACTPGTIDCTMDFSAVQTCRADGSGYDITTMCDTPNGFVCRMGACVSLCAAPDITETNIGCEYYAVDLDNAQAPGEGNAAAQQYAVVVSNIDPTTTARVHVEWNTAPQGMPPIISTVATSVIAPMDLEAFLLPKRVVDCGDPFAQMDTGTGTCLSSQAYHIVSSIPVVAYQFNPYTNASVFSNDASLLLPTNSIDGNYIVLTWPQTDANTTSPMTNMGIDLRGYVTIVGTQANTHVMVTPSAAVIPGVGALSSGIAVGTPFSVTLGQFDVLNLETGAFHADLTGTQITTDNPVAVFAGTEASDSPVWDVLSDRECCADHAEEQLSPRRTAATDFVAVHMASRTQAVANAGGEVAVVAEPSYFRIMNAGTVRTHVTTTLPSDPTDQSSPGIEFDLLPGASSTQVATQDFNVHGDQPLFMSLRTGGQQTTGIPFTLPGGDPSMITEPPLNQWRQNYVFLTPDKYAFDFVTIVARPAANVQLDGTPLPFTQCPLARADGCVDEPSNPCPAPTYVVYRCQLSFPVIVNGATPPGNVQDGLQGDGVHTVTSDDMMGVMVIVSGFDNYVGYGYPAGMQTSTYTP